MKWWIGVFLVFCTPSVLPGQEPFFKAKEKPTRFEGPGRDDPEPRALEDVRIGYFGPGEPAHPEAGDVWQAASLAIEEANAEGGFRGIPFTLTPRWADNPWGNGSNLVARMVYSERVWAIIGGIDGPSTHIAEQIAAKARLPLIGPVATDKSANMANVPWMFSAVPGDHVLARVLADTLVKEAGKGSFVLASATDHDSHQFLVEFEKNLTRLRASPEYRYEFESGQDYSELAGKIVDVRAQTVVLIAGARDSASFANSLRRKGFVGRIFGGPAMGRRLFRDRLATQPGGIVFPVSADTCSGADVFGRRFAARFGFAPDFAARYAYESTRLLVAAICRAGLNRVRICDALRELSPWEGTAASIDWDPLGRNRSPVAVQSCAPEDPR